MQTSLTLRTSSNIPIVSVRSLLDIRKSAPRYKDVDAAERQAWLMEKIVYCNALNHTKPDPTFIKVDTAALDEAMMKDAKIADLTAPEISFAMFHGTMGEYGEYYGLTARTFMGFFREFFKTDIKFCVEQEEKKAAQPARGDWVLARMEHHRQEVERQRRDEDMRDEADAALEGWKKTIANAIKSSQQ